MRIEDIPEDVDVQLLEPRELYDPAFLGLIHQGGWTVALYSRKKLLEQLELDANEDDDSGELREHLDFNVTGSMGEGFPWFLLDEES